MQKKRIVYLVESSRARRGKSTFVISNRKLANKYKQDHPFEEVTIVPLTVHTEQFWEPRLTNP